MPKRGGVKYKVYIECKIVYLLVSPKLKGKIIISLEW